MIFSYRRRIYVEKPFKVWKAIVQTPDGTWYTGLTKRQKIFPGEWLHIPNPEEPNSGFHAFKSRAAATEGLYVMSRRGLIKDPSYVVPCYMTGDILLGVYLLHDHANIKAVLGRNILFKAKHIPRGIYD